jgi:proline iminopeptidase
MRVERVAIDRDATLWTCTSGSGVPVVLCHGGPGLWDDLGDVAAAVDDVATVHRYDQRGCGRSIGGGPYATAAFVDDLDALRRHFGHEQWIVGGHSWGATLALEYALAHPERTRGLVLIGSWVLFQAFQQEYRAERERRLGAHRARYEELKSRERTVDEDCEYAALSWSTDFADRERALELAWGLLRDPSLVVNYACNAQINVERHATDEAAFVARLRELRVPALIVHGSEDLRPLRATDGLLDALSLAERVVIEGAGHFPWVEAPEEFRAALRAFVSKVTSV